MTRAQICDRAVFLSSVCHGENADQALNEWLDVDAAQRQTIKHFEQLEVTYHDAIHRHEQIIEQLEGRVKALEGALEALILHIDMHVYRDFAQLRLGPAVPVYERAQAALAATGEEHD
jgi:hypothetical protein